jgi:hypothetical protein
MTALDQAVLMEVAAEWSHWTSAPAATFLVLRRRYRDVYYWRNGGEVDFVVLQAGRPVPVQVTWNKPLERHQKGLDSFYQAHHDAHEAVFVNATSFAAGLPELAGARS